MLFVRIWITMMIGALTACSTSNDPSHEPGDQVNNDQTQNITSGYDSIDISLFCASINGVTKTLYALTEGNSPPLLFNPFITSRLSW